MTDMNALHAAQMAADFNAINDNAVDAFDKMGKTATMDLNNAMELAEFTGLLRAKKTGNVINDNKNLIGGLIGGALAVGLEIASPTGSTASATAAGIAAAGTLYMTHKVLDNVPQTTGLAAANGALTCFVSMTAGRIVADYFPGHLVAEEEE